MTIRNPGLLTLYRRALIDAARRFDAKNGWAMSSHVAMSMMMALFPFILFVVALAGLLTRQVNTEDVIDLVFGSWPQDVARPITRELRAVLAGSGTQLLTLGGVLAIYFASNGVNAVRVAMNQAYHDADPRPFWKARLICVGLVVAGGAAILGAALIELVLPVYANMLRQAVPGQVTAHVSDWFDGVGFGWLFIVAVPSASVLACHVLLPAQRHRLRSILPGVVLTLALWALAGWGFSVYVARFASYSATYAGLAGAMAALIFLYLNSAILIYGAEFNGALRQLREDADRDDNASDLIV